MGENFSDNLAIHQDMLNNIKNTKSSERLFIKKYEMYESQGIKHCPLVESYYTFLLQQPL